MNTLRRISVAVALCLACVASSAQASSSYLERFAVKIQTQTLQLNFACSAFSGLLVYSQGCFRLTLDTKMRYLCDSTTLYTIDDNAKEAVFENLNDGVKSLVDNLPQTLLLEDSPLKLKFLYADRLSSIVYRDPSTGKDYEFTILGSAFSDPLPSESFTPEKLPNTYYITDLR